MKKENIKHFVVPCSKHEQHYVCNHKYRVQEEKSTHEPAQVNCITCVKILRTTCPMHKVNHDRDKDKQC